MTELRHSVKLSQRAEEFVSLLGLEIALPACTTPTERSASFKLPLI